jgi:hypothetical protein
MDAKQSDQRISKCVNSRPIGYPSEPSSLPCFVDKRITDGDEAVRLTRRPRFNPGMIPGTHLLEAESTLGTK